ncbi:MAG: triphosphoribosyl-dephospho-CoA synthase [Candidatus Competibacterales bacterium]|nr:triphosphoribosyl-dephospho-CoA synthase [Candidatus Competibacterales bacterium]
MTPEQAYLDACQQELTALKPGNVGHHAPGHGMDAALFETSARVSAPVLADARLGVGERILAAVRATRAAVDCNTNLGILLLAAPLLRAAETGAGPLRERLRAVLAGLDQDDTAAVFEAIRLAAPGGLGRSPEHDVAGPARAGLVTVMAAAAGRDRIARQYASGYDDVFDTGLPALAWAGTRWADKSWASVYSYLVFLARFSDTHVLRKLGPSTAEEVSRVAAELRNRLARSARPELFASRLLALDREWKARGINPGTSADLTVATLLAERLQSSLREEKNQHG